MRSTSYHPLQRSTLIAVPALVSTAVLWTFSLTRSEARPIHSDVPTVTTVISKEEISQTETGVTGLLETVRQIHYQDDHMSSISSRYFGQSQDKPDTTTVEMYDPRGRLTGFEYHPRTGPAFHETFDYSSALNPGDLPKINLSQLGPNLMPFTPTWVKDSKIIAMPDQLPAGLQPYMSAITPQYGTIIYPGTKDGATFSTLPIFPGAPASLDTGLLLRGFHPSTGGQDITRCNLWFDGRSFPLSGSSIRIEPPATTGSSVPFVITNPDGSLLAIGAFPSVPGGRLTPDKDTPIPQIPGFWLPTVGQAGRPVTIYGPFDGDSSNTRITFNGDVVPVFQETVDSAVVTLQDDIFGTTSLHVKENGHDVKVSHTNIGIKLSDDGRILKPGETGPVDVKVMGLEHITKPVTLTMVNLDPDIVSMNGGDFQQFEIAPGSGDTINKHYSVVGIKRGAADIVGRVPQIWTLTDTPLQPGDTTGTTDTGTGTTTTAEGGPNAPMPPIGPGGVIPPIGGGVPPPGGGVVLPPVAPPPPGGGIPPIGPPPVAPPPDGPPPHTPPDDPHNGNNPDNVKKPIVIDGWLEPSQGVFQDDNAFKDKPTKQLTKLGPASWQAELRMVQGRPTLLYGLRDTDHDTIEIDGTTFGSTWVPVRFKFTLYENGQKPFVIYTEPAAHNQVKLDGPPGVAQDFKATLNAHDGVHTDDKKAFTFQSTGPYRIVAELIRPDGSPTGLSATVAGETVRTVPVKVYFEPILLQTPRDDKLDVAMLVLTGTGDDMAVKSRRAVPLWFPMKPDGFQTQGLDVRDYRDEVRRSNAALQDVTENLDQIRAEHFTALASRELSAQAYHEKANRIYVVLRNNDFDILGSPDAVAFTATQKVIFIRKDEKVDTIAHEYVHTTPFLWSSRQMRELFGFSYHNVVDPKVADGAYITMDGDEIRESDKIAVMGSSSKVADQWISQGTYWHLIDEFIAPHDPPVIAVTGIITNRKGKFGGTLAPLYHQDGVADLKDGPGDWAIELRDKQGAVLGHYPFTPEWQLPDTEKPRGEIAISYCVPDLPGIASVLLVGPNGVLNVRVLSAHAPSVTITSPTSANAAGVVNGKVQVAWKGSDADGDPLLYTVVYSPNGGDDWYVESFEQTASSFAMSLENGAKSPVVKVIATDGGRSSEAVVKFRVK